MMYIQLLKGDTWEWTIGHNYLDGSIVGIRTHPTFDLAIKEPGNGESLHNFLTTSDVANKRLKPFEGVRLIKKDLPNTYKINEYLLNPFTLKMGQRKFFLKTTFL